jgi:hypothetical protein
VRDDERHDVEWTAVERQKLDSLARTRVPSDLLWQRTLIELRKQGLVRRRRSFSAKQLVWMAVAASAVFAAGGILGYRLALTRVETQSRLATVAADSPPPSNLSTNMGHVVWF